MTGYELFIDWELNYRRDTEQIINEKQGKHNCIYCIVVYLSCKIKWVVLRFIWTLRGDNMDTVWDEKKVRKWTLNFSFILIIIMLLVQCFHNKKKSRFYTHVIVSFTYVHHIELNPIHKPQIFICITQSDRPCQTVSPEPWPAHELAVQRLLLCNLLAHKCMLAALLQGGVYVCVHAYAWEDICVEFRVEWVHEWNTCCCPDGGKLFTKSLGYVFQFFLSKQYNLVLSHLLLFIMFVLWQWSD